jgi:hypothetical protein
VNAVRSRKQVGYSKSAAEVFTEAIKYILNYIQSAKVLFHAGVIDVFARRPSISTWVPDWSLTSANSHKSLVETDLQENFHPTQLLELHVVPLLLFMIGPF